MQQGVAYLAIVCILVAHQGGGQSLPSAAIVEMKIDGDEIGSVRAHLMNAPGGNLVPSAMPTFPVMNLHDAFAVYHQLCAKGEQSIEEKQKR